MSKLLLAIILMCLAAAPSVAAPKAPKADAILSSAKSQAVQQHKSIFLIFGASWCEDCHRLDAFFAVPEVHAIFDKYYVTTRLTVGEENGGNPSLNNPGAVDQLIKFGGVGPGGVTNIPFIAILSEKGKLIVNANRPTAGNSRFEAIGYPTKPEEIDWFIAMLKKNAPALTVDEAQVVRSALAKN